MQLDFTTDSIIIDSVAWKKIQLYTKYAKGEISGLGLVESVNGALYIPDVYLFEQVSSYADTKLDQMDVAKFISGMMDKGLPTETIKLWWHSHADMDVFWSKVDEDNIQDFDNETNEDNWLLSIVVNKKGEYLARLDIFRPYRVRINNIKLSSYTNYKQLEEAIKEEVENKVLTPVKVYGKNGSYDDFFFGGKKNGPATSYKYNPNTHDYEEEDDSDKVIVDRKRENIGFLKNGNEDKGDKDYRSSTFKKFKKKKKHGHKYFDNTSKKYNEGKDYSDEQGSKEDRDTLSKPDDTYLNKDRNKINTALENEDKQLGRTEGDYDF